MASLSAYYPLPVVAGTTAGTYAEGNDPRFGDGLEEAPEDGTPYARKDADWISTVELEEDGSIAAIVQVRQGTEAQLDDIVLNNGEIAVETTNSIPTKFRVGNGIISGGFAPSGWDFYPQTGTQTVTNSSTLVPVTAFSQLHLDPDSFYEVAVSTVFQADGAGGLKLSASNGLLNGLTATITGWTDEQVSPIQNIPIIGEFYNESSLSGAYFLYIHGVVSTYTAFSDFDEFGNPVIINPENNRLLLSFAQSTASTEGEVLCYGAGGSLRGSFFAVKKLK